MINLSPQHQKKVLNHFTWAIFWGLSCYVFFQNLNLNWFNYLYLTVSTYVFWSRLINIWTSYQYGKHQALLKHKQIVPTDNYGVSSFATFEEKEAVGLYDGNSGFPIGRDENGILFYDPVHALCVAPAGSGKTVSIALPAKAHGYRVAIDNGMSEASSCVVTDLKGEIAAASARLSKDHHGHKVYFLNPDNLYDLGNTKFNPLQIIIDDLTHAPSNKYAMADATELVLQLLPEPPEGDKNAFFRHGSRNIIICLILWLAAENPKCCILPEIFRIVSSVERLKEALEQATNCTKLSGDIGLIASGLLSTNEDQISDFITGAFQAVLPFSPSSPLANSVSATEFMFDTLKQERISVYIIARYDRKEAYAPWVGLITKCAIKSLIRTNGNIPVHFLLDEATNIPLPGLSGDLTALRGYGLRAHIICQGKSELRRVYGKESTETFYSQTDLKQFFGVSSYEEAKEISDYIGSKTVKTENLGDDKTSPWSDIKDSFSEAGRALLMPEEILQMGNDEQLILINGLKPIKCKRLPYFHVPQLHSMIDANPLEGEKIPLIAKAEIDYQEASS